MKISIEIDHEDIKHVASVLVELLQDVGANPQAFVDAFSKTFAMATGDSVEPADPPAH